jgi:hypothetical protein
MHYICRGFEFEPQSSHLSILNVKFQTTKLQKKKKFTLNSYLRIIWPHGQLHLLIIKKLYFIFTFMLYLHFYFYTIYSNYMHDLYVLFSSKTQHCLHLYFKKRKLFKTKSPLHTLFFSLNMLIKLSLFILFSARWHCNLSASRVDVLTSL